jgi:6-phosphofructokinase 1
MMWTMPQLKRTQAIKRIALLTSGGDAPGMNAAVRAVVRTALERDVEAFGVEKGYSGLVHGQMALMDRASVANILHRGGTVLKTDRSEEFKRPEVRKRIAEDLRRQDIGALVVIGGDGSLTGAHLLQTETGFPVIGLPGTIDNDIFGTDDSIGFDTAVNTALEAIDRIRDTATSHERVFLVEVMGRSTGFIAASVGIAGGAEIVLMPGRDLGFEEICHTLKESERRGKKSSLIVIAEGENPNLTNQLTRSLNEHGFQARAAILGHVQRGGSPTGHDRVLASMLGSAAVDYLLAGQSDLLVGVRGDEVIAAPLAQVIGKKKEQPREHIALARLLAT